jgi:hypothetical protein
MNGSLDRHPGREEHELSSNGAGQPDTEKMERGRTGWRGLIVTQAKTLTIFFIALAVLAYQIAIVSCFISI